MNQLQTILAAIKKWGFWVICGLAVVLGLGVWFVAQQSVLANIKSRKDQLEGLRSQVSAVKPASPNAQVVEATRKKIEELKSDVYQAWVSMYAAQKEKNQWPAALGTDFLNWVNQPGRKFGDPIPERFREIYLNFIDQHFPTLFEIVNLRRPKGTDLKRLGSVRSASGTGTGYATSGYGTGAGYPGAVSTIGEEAYGTEYAGPMGTTGYPGASGTGAAPTVEMEGIVEWNPQNIAAIKQRFAWIKVPTSEEIWNAQEDLWVYEALLRIIANTNENATGPHNATVKRINAIEIGPDAARYLGAAVASATPSSTLGSGSAIPTSAAGGYGEPVGEAGAPPGYGGYGSGYGTAASPLYGRYVDADGRPLAPGSQQPFAEFKMMPVRLDLVVDQRKIDQLLVNCVNSDMPVRITRVLIRPSQATAAASGGGYGVMGSSGPGFGTGYGTSEEYGESATEAYGGGYGTGTSGTTTLSTAMTYDVPIVIEGIIYLFNPPNIAELGKPGAPELPSGESLATPAPAEAAQGQPTAGQPAAEGQTAPAGAAQPAAGGPTAPLGAQPEGVPATPAAGGPTQPSAPATGEGAQGGQPTPPAGAPQNAPTTAPGTPATTTGSGAPPLPGPTAPVPGPVPAPPQTPAGGPPTQP